ncbi:HNH endonuclease [Anaerobacillus alkalilacustris]|uniref:Putative HNH nuclease YajD n=1 Tax=Anaerobacillus alkalilacustris TaxID=393763 RepID=A0A1S2LZ83_9BACI|nr:HNH endonuclease [Anaerobacillus alkalilacustris]
MAILKRDEYQCRECRRYGKATQADMVHHVYPMETHPKLAFNNDNLISLCNRCHEKMHNRFDRGFTDKGKEWMDRLADKLIPPT